MATSRPNMTDIAAKTLMAPRAVATPENRMGHRNTIGSDFYQLARTALESRRVPGKKFDFELRENVADQDFAVLLRVFNRIRNDRF